MMAEKTAAPAGPSGQPLVLATMLWGEGPPTHLIRLSDADMTRLAEEVVAVIEWRKDPPTSTVSPGPSSVVPEGDLAMTVFYLILRWAMPVQRHPSVVGASGHS